MTALRNIGARRPRRLSESPREGQLRTRPSAPEHHRPDRGGTPAPVQRGPHPLDGLQRRNLQLRLPPQGAEGPGPPLLLPDRQRGDPPSLRGGGRCGHQSPRRDVRPGDLVGTSAPFARASPVGIKPLVYYADAKRFVFASELKALLADPAVPKEIDPGGARPLSQPELHPAPWTIFRNIRKVRPGHILKVHGARLQSRGTGTLQRHPPSRSHT